MTNPASGPAFSVGTTTRGSLPGTPSRARSGTVRGSKIRKRELRSLLAGSAPWPPIARGRAAAGLRFLRAPHNHGQDGNDLACLLDKPFQSLPRHDLGRNQKAKPVLALPRFLQSDATLGPEIGPRVTGLRFFQIGSYGCGRTQQLPGKYAVCPALPIEEATQLHHTTGVLEGTRDDISAPRPLRGRRRRGQRRPRLCLTRGSGLVPGLLSHAPMRVACLPCLCILHFALFPFLHSIASTCAILYIPAGLWFRTSHLAARSAPRANVSREVARWVSSRRSPPTAKCTVWSPTTSPSRTA